MKPDQPLVKRVSPELTVSTLAEREKAYAIYLHLPLPKKPKQLSEHLKQDLLAAVVVDLPPRDYRVEWVDTKTGRWSGKSRSRTLAVTGRLLRRDSITTLPCG
jgi:hypothetical protein